MSMTNKIRQKQLSRMQQDCDDWNTAHPVGSAVMVKLDGEDEPIATTTRSTAQILSGHTVVIWLTGVSGCYKLTHVRAAATPAEQVAAANDLKRKLS